MNVLHLSRTPVSGAPQKLCRAQGKYASRVNKYNYIHITSDTVNSAETKHHVMNADVIHWHNEIYYPIYNVVKNKKHVIQYHSEPGVSGVGRYPVPVHVRQLVIAHYHSALKYFKHCTPVRNVVDVDLFVEEPVQRQSDLIVCSSLSTHRFGAWQTKDVERHAYVMKRVTEHFKGKISIHYKNLNNLPWVEVMKHKYNSDIVLDECVTPSYHLSSLEGLVCGRPTICWTDSHVNKQLLEVTGAGRVPFLGTYIGWLEDYLVDLLEQGPGNLKREGKLAREWFEKYWDPHDIVDEYASIYNEL